MRTKVFFLFSFFLFLLSCSNPFANQQLAMTADPGVTEAWLSLHVDGVRSGADYIVQRDGTTVFKGRLQSPDTMVYDSLLMPATTYTYRFYARENGDNSPALQSTLTTMDTTSHNFSWQSYEFGVQNGSSYFNDVAIIDENDIWAVGEIHPGDTDQYDSLGHWVQPYNATHWDGQKWKLKQVPFVGSCSAVHYPPLRAVWGFNSENIIFSNGGSLVNYNGKDFKMDCRMNSILSGAIDKIWGTSSQDFYVVGNSGMIAHYDGTSWTKIESGTDLDIQDIWGVFGSMDNIQKVWAIGSKKFKADSKIVIQISNRTATEIKSNGLGASSSGIWSGDGKNWYASGEGVFKRRYQGRRWQSLSGVPLIFSECIRGNLANDVFIGGHYGLLLHWNGISWRDFTASKDIFYSIAVQNRQVAAVGTRPIGIVAGPAIIRMGKRF